MKERTNDRTNKRRTNERINGINQPIDAFTFVKQSINQNIFIQRRMSWTNQSHKNLIRVNSMQH